MEPDSGIESSLGTCLVGCPGTSYFVAFRQHYCITFLTHLAREMDLRQLFIDSSDVTDRWVIIALARGDGARRGGINGLY